MRSLCKIACVVSVVIAAGFSLPAMAARSNEVSTWYFDASGNFVGQSLYSCESRHFEGGTVTQYVVEETYGCYPGPPANGQSGLQPNEVYSIPPPGFTQAQLCQVLARYGGAPCNINVAPVFTYPGD